MTDIAFEQEVELTPEKLNDYVEAAASVVEELRDFLALHHATLIQSLPEPNKWGQSMTMPEAHKNPEFAGRVHNLRLACDNFINAMRGHY